MKFNDDLDPDDAWFGDPDEDDGVTLPPVMDEEERARRNPTNATVDNRETDR